MSRFPRMDHEEKLARIREVAMTVREPRNAGEIADLAGVARNTAEKYLTQLVEADKLTTIEVGRETRYYPDPVTQLFDHLGDLIESQSKEALTAELAAIRDDIDELAATYDVDSPDELRASIGDEGLTATERAQRRTDAEDWEYYQFMAEQLKLAIQLYDMVERAREHGAPPLP